MRIWLIVLLVVTVFSILAGEEEKNVIISLVGDICFDGNVKKRIKEKGGDALFEGYREWIDKSDIVIANLETAVSEKGSAIPGKSYTFRSSPNILKVLKKNKVRIVSIANNHVLDYGVTAFKDTMKNLRKNSIGFSGGAVNKSDTNKFAVTYINGVKVGFLAFSKVVPCTTWHIKENNPGVMGIYPFQEKEALKLISIVDKKCDILIVSVHFGKERSLSPGKDEKLLARKIIDSGADIIMGHHTHTVQEYEYYRGKPIFYSLGNFIFSNSNIKVCNKTVMAVLKINKKGKIEKIDMVRGEIVKNIPLAYSGYVYKELKKSEKTVAIKKIEYKEKKIN
jgi:poly-gamma-glutamate capsule biosynthesis protein CapA/YwtB (metallophosphatase superfamily)